MGRWIYNVGVNVVGNLVTAGVIYLLGAFAGYWDPRPLPAALALVAVFYAAFLVYMSIVYVRPEASVSRPGVKMLGGEVPAFISRRH